LTNIKVIKMWRKSWNQLSLFLGFRKHNYNFQYCLVWWLLYLYI